MFNTKVVKGLLLQNLRDIRKSDFKKFRLGVYVVIIEGKYQLRVGINNAPGAYITAVTLDYSEWQKDKNVDIQLDEILSIIDREQRQALRG